MKLQITIASIVVVVLVALGFTYTVDESQFAIKKQLGQVKQVDLEPGLKFKLPFVQDIQKFDKRLQTVDLPPGQFLTSEQKYMIVDSFVKWRINDVVSFYTSTNGDFFRARSRLSDLINNTLKSAISQNTIQEAISDKRSEIMSSVQVAVNEKAANLGIEVTDVRIKRLDFPDNVRGKVFERMAKDREKEARELRSTGKEQANIITADADRQSQEILAEAYKQAEELRGEGDAKAAEVYAKAYGSDREFYKFYRSLDAYRSSFGSKSDVLVIEPDSEFFKYFNSSSGK